MNVSPSFLLGLGVAVLSEELVEWLPGSATAGTLAVSALAIPLPGLWARVTGLQVRRLAQNGRRPGPLLWLALRLQPLTVPLAFLSLTALGGLLELAEHEAPDSHAIRFALVLAPLFMLELSLRSTELRTVGWLELRRLDPPVGISPSFLGMTLLVIVAVLLFGLVLDAVALDRGLDVFFHGTMIGTTTGTIAMVLGLAALLPVLFRYVLPTSSTLPERVASDIRSAAERLDFPPHRVVALHTDMRIVNAALVGPLRWPRYLVLTDGIMAFLDRVALRGVVAHEVGHARAGHPVLLLLVFAIVPLLLVHPASRVDLDDIDPFVLFGAGAIAALVGFVALRALMHRFEYEADQLSAEALGGALPCIAALRRVGDLFPSQRGHASLRHPSEEQRVRSLTLWDTDPAYRNAFVRRGRAVRRAIFATLLAALAISTWSHLGTLPTDRAVLALYTGDFRAARAALPDIDASADPNRSYHLHEEIEAAIELLPAGGAWHSIRTELADRAWRRALDVATTAGPAAARPYFSLALSEDGSDPVRASAWLWSEAAATDDEPRFVRIAAHLATLAETPPELIALVTR